MEQFTPKWPEAIVTRYFDIQNEMLTKFTKYQIVAWQERKTVAKHSN